MDEFLKTWYGLYPKWIDETNFETQNGHYCIQDCFIEEKQFYRWIEINQRMMSRLNIGGFIPVPNLNGKVITQGKVVFFIQCSSFDLEDLWKQNQMICSSNRALIDLREKWIEKVEFVSRRYLYEVDCHQKDYAFRMALIQYYVGIAKTAITILNDLMYDYPSPLPLNHLCHRRIVTLNPLCCMNPMNFMIDHPARDLCELYVRQIIDFDTVCHCFERFAYSSQAMHYFFARLLFPSWFFDKIEDNYFSQQANDFDEQGYLNQHMLFVKTRKEMYVYLSSRIRLKPLEW